MNEAMLYVLCAGWVLAVMALLRHHGVLLWFGENLGLLDDTTPRWLRWLYDPNPETTDMDEEQE